MQKAQTTSILGIMSGTSLDGLDLALCVFKEKAKGYSYSINKALTIPYSQQWKTRLGSAQNLSAEGYFELHSEYGRYIGEQVQEFLKQSALQPNAISSHGHTVFHQPSRGFSVQLGSGASIAALTGITTVCDFRSLDVALGGQGAPLVPIGDRLLFGEHQACLNIGGIANISFENNGSRIAYDICVANMLLNFLALKKGKEYDHNGDMARAGKIDYTLLEKLNGLDFYRSKGARSLGREWFEKEMLPLLNNDQTNDLLATCTEHVAMQIAADLDLNSIKNILVTGGGAFNSFLIERVKQHCSASVTIPEAEVVNFKEALIFAFLGYLRLNLKANALRSVTGALHDNIGGAVYIGNRH